MVAKLNKSINSYIYTAIISIAMRTLRSDQGKGNYNINITIFTDSFYYKDSTTS